MTMLILLAHEVDIVLPWWAGVAALTGLLVVGAVAIATVIVLWRTKQRRP